MNNTRISQIHREIEKLQKAKEDTDVQFTLDAIDEEIDMYEQEICKLLDEEDEVEEPVDHIDYSGATEGDR